MFVLRRLGILKTLIQELGLTLTVKLVKSEENKADALTRIRKLWLVPEMGVRCAALEEVKKMHDKHHMGVERTWYLAKRLAKSAKKETVKAVDVTTNRYFIVQRGTPNIFGKLQQ